MTPRNRASFGHSQPLHCGPDLHRRSLSGTYSRMTSLGETTPAAYLLDPETLRLVYGDEARSAIADLLGAPPLETSCAGFDKEGLSAGLSSVRVLLSGWGMPRLTPAVLDSLPSLELVLYAAGSVAGFMTEHAWERGVRVSSASEINAKPTAEFAAAQILLGLKGFWQHNRAMRDSSGRLFDKHRKLYGIRGGRVGLVSLGLIGRLTAQRLVNAGAEVVAFDPYASQAVASELGVTLVSLEELFASSRVVSVHTPWLAETEGMINASLMHQLAEGACLVNTARGAVINESDLLVVAQDRPDLTFLLDVTHPHEPPLPASPLYRAPNVLLSPHIAGSVGRECLALGDAMADELRRFVSGQPLRYELRRQVTSGSAHASPSPG